MLCQYSDLAYLFFEKHGLKTVNVDKLETHGGSLRLTLVKSDSYSEVKNEVYETLEDEKKYDPLNFEVVARFQEHAEQVRDNLLKTLRITCISQGKFKVVTTDETIKEDDTL